VRSILIFIALLMVLPSPALGQMADRNAKAEREVRQLEGELREAWLRGDTSTLERLLADDWKIIHTNGREQTKAQFIDAIKSGRVKFKSMEFDEVEVRVYGDAAVVTARSTNRIEFRGQESSGQVRVTRVYVRRREGWCVVNEQASRIEQ
jgi:uncharacterized protein (TIGR02246 family)